VIDSKIMGKFENFFEEEHSISHEILKGQGCVMFSAPHSVSQTRNGATKAAEPQTGTLVRLLNYYMDIPVIYKTANKGDDPNFDAYSPYKEDLASFILSSSIKVLFDIHLLSSRRSTYIAIGTGKGKNCNNPLIVNAVREELGGVCNGEVQVDGLFSSSGKHTVSSSIAAKCGIQCVQIEINSRLVYPQYSEYCIERVYEALVNIAKRSEEAVKGEAL